MKNKTKSSGPISSNCNAYGQRTPYTILGLIFYILHNCFLSAMIIKAELLKDKLCLGSKFWVKPFRRHNSLSNWYFHPNLYTQSYYWAILRSHTVHSHRQINDFWEFFAITKRILVSIKNVRSFPKKKSRILDPRILPLRSSA